MKYIRTTIFAIFLLLSYLSANQPHSISNNIIHLKFNNLKIEDFIKMVAKVTNKNILLTFKIPGKVNFISTSPLHKDEIFNILLDVLEARGFTLIEDGDYLKVVRSSRAIKEGLNFATKTPGVMRTSIIHIKNINVDLVAVKIRPFLSIGGKIITLRDINSMVVSDYPKNISIIRKLALHIDKELAKKNMDIEFVSLQYAQVDRIINKILRIARTVINQKIPTNKVEILSNNATNSLIIIANRENINKLLPYIKKLDVKDNLSEHQIAVIPLENAEAKELIKTVNQLLSKKRYVKPEDRPTISIDEEMNSIIVSASGKDIKMIKQMIKMLDKERPQVYIMAKIVEISELKTKQIGIKYGLEGGKVTSTALYTMALNLGGTSVAAGSLNSILKMPENITEGVALGAFIDFLNKEGAAEVLSEPSILCINNKESSIYVGKTESVLVSSIQGNSTTDLARNTYKREDIGLTLKIKPRISSGNKVTIKASLVQEDTAGGQPGLPITTKRQVETNAIVNNGESVILGGLIKSKYDDKTMSIPILGDIPVLGYFFRNKEKIRDKVNLVVILTPFIIKNSKDMEKLRHTLYRLNKLEEKYYDILINKLKIKKVKPNVRFSTNP